MVFKRLSNTARRILPKNRFARSVSVLAGGTAVGQIIVVAASPVLTRLYSPEDFGLLAVFASLLGILGVIASLRYQLAIPLPESEEEAANVTILSFLIVLGMVLITTVVVIPGRVFIAEALNAPLLAEYIWLLPLSLLLFGIYQVLNYWSIRVKAYTSIAQTKLTRAVSMVAVQLIGFPLGSLGLLLGRVFGQAAGIIKLGLLSIVSGRQAFRKVTFIGIRKASTRYYSFPVYSSWAGLVNAGGTHTPPILFSILYSPSAAGLYMLAQRVISLPLTLVGLAIADVYLPNAVEAMRENRLRESVASLQRQLAWIVFPPAAVLIVVSPEVFRIAFGADWEQAGHMVRWLVPMLILQFIVSPLSRIFVALERQKLGLILQVNHFMLRFGSLVVAGYLGVEILDAVIWFGTASGFGYFIYLIAIAFVTGNSIRAFVKSWASCLPWLLLVLLPLISVSYFGDSDMVWVEAMSLMVSITLLLIYYKRAFPWS